MVCYMYISFFFPSWQTETCLIENLLRPPYLTCCQNLKSYLEYVGKLFFGTVEGSYQGTFWFLITKFCITSVLHSSGEPNILSHLENFLHNKRLQVCLK